MKLTIKELAKMAGVSTTTVSRALNNGADIREDTKKRIMELVEQYNYVPSDSARNLAKSRSMTIALIMPHTPKYMLSNPYLQEVLVAISETVASHDYNMYYIWQKSFDYSTLIKNRKCDGIIMLMVKYNDPWVEVLKEEDCPFVLIGDHKIGAQIRRIDSQEASGTAQAVGYLYERGHRKLAFIGGNTQFSSWFHRVKGFAAACEELGLDMDSDYIIPSSLSMERQGELLVEQALSLPEPPTGLVCFNDPVAIGALRELKRRGIQVPGDMGIVGFDNISFCEICDPMLTSVNNIAYEKGRIAAEWLIDVINERDTQTSPILMPMHLVPRET